MRPSLIDLLPQALAAHQVPDPNERTGFRVDPAMADFLQAFESVLLRRLLPPEDEPTEPKRGLEEIVDDLARYFTSGTNGGNGAPDDFLPWLSQWVALSLRADIFQAGARLTRDLADKFNGFAGGNDFLPNVPLNQSDANKLNLLKRREFIGQMIYFYRKRGTKANMKQLLEIFTCADATIIDQVDGKPHFFIVELSLEALKGSGDRASFFRAQELAHSVIQLEKPAHTYYQLVPQVITMRIGRSWRTPDGRRDYYIRLRDARQEGNSLLGYVPTP